MKSKYINFKENVEYEKLNEPAQAIKEGKLVLFPTETVYGIGANALDADAARKIFVAKGRAGDNPLIVHIADKEMLKELVTEIGEIEKKLIEKFWPGPLTIIFKKKDIIPDVITGGLDTVAIRMPSNEIAKALIKYSMLPIAAPSANISGKPSGTMIEDIIDELDGKVDYIIDAGKVDIGIESTVIIVIENKVHILRPGKISKEDIEKLGIEVMIDKNVLDKFNPNDKVLSPGMKYKHYAPNTKCILVYSKDETKMIEKINEIANKNDAVIICKTSHVDNYKNNTVLEMGNTLEEISSNIFTLLRKADKLNKEIVIIEGVEKNNLGLAIMNRLIRSCGHNYIEI